MGKAGPRPIVLDAGALIAVERGDERMRALLREVHEQRVPVVVPAAVLAQVWRERTSRIHAVIKGATTVVAPLDQLLAQAAGVLCGRRKTADVVDATVVLLARRMRGLVLTSDAKDIRRLDANVAVETV